MSALRVNSANVKPFSDRAGFVDFLRVQAGLPEADSFRFGNSGSLAVRSNFTPLLRRVILVGEAALRERIDFQRIDLRAGGGTDPRGL